MGMRDGEVKEKKIYSIKRFLFDSPHLLIHPKQVQETFDLSTYQSFRASNDSFRQFLCVPIYLSIHLPIYEFIHHFCVTFFMFLPGERGGISAADDCHRFTVSDENPSRWNETKEWFRLNTMKFDF